MHHFNPNLSFSFRLSKMHPLKMPASIIDTKLLFLSLRPFRAFYIVFQNQFVHGPVALCRPCYVQKLYLCQYIDGLGQLTYFLCSKTIQFQGRIINSFLSWIERFRGIDNLFQ